MRRDVKQRSFSKQAIANIAASNKIQGKKVSKKYKQNPNVCKICSTTLPYSNRHRTTCSEQCLTTFYRNKAINTAEFGGNRNNQAYEWYTSTIAGKVWLESSYEYKVATQLDNNKVLWTRPRPLEYELNGICKRYYPDFYLVDYDIYLDPKNDYLIEQDEEKINLVQTVNDVTIIVLDKDNLSWVDILDKLG